MEPKKPELHTMVLRLAAVLLSLVLISSGMVTGRYARYASSAGGSDYARAAKYQISVTPISGNNITLSPDAPAEYLFSVASSSEVAVEYDLILLLPKALPEGVAVSLKCGDRLPVLVQNGNQFSAQNAGVFPAQGGTHSYTLTLTATGPIGADTLAGISIRVNARQAE